jgi:hypothetical protein
LLVSWQLERLADEGTCVIQGPAWRCPIRMRCHSVGDGSTATGCPHSIGDGCTGSEVTERMCSAHLASQHYPGRASGRWAYAPRGRCRPFSRERGGGRTGAGSTVSRNDARHSAQCSYSVRDGRTVAGCPYSVGTGFPGGVRRSTWWGFPFDPGARGMSRHLMLRSGVQVRYRGSRGSLERDGDSLEGL